MPKARRYSAGGGIDSRPAFSRPPGKVSAPISRDVPPEKKKQPSTPTKATRTNKAKQSPATTPIRKSADVRRKSGSPAKSSPSPTKEKAKYTSSTSTGESTQVLSVDSLAKLNALNEKTTTKEKEIQLKDREKHHKHGDTTARRKKRTRHVSGGELEEGRGEKTRTKGIRGGGSEIYMRMRERGGKDRGNKRCLLIVVAVLILLLIILIPVGVFVVGKHHGNSGSSSATTSTTNNLPNADTIPAGAKGTVLDPYTWLDTTDFNTTYTNATVGGLPIMGLNLAWDDTARANDLTPPLNQNWTYGTRPIRGTNIGGWLSIEPFITPSLFDSYSSKSDVVDEYTLSTTLGPALAAQIIEKHYSTFVTEQTFIDIANAGLDHVRIPYPYWSVTTYEGDPYVPKIAWRYLLRGIEWARKHGLRVNLDLHSLPGSQNGWNHSGRQGSVGWLNGTDGTLNAQRSLDLHNQLSQFFAQPRYDNVVTFYGLVNEPKMMSLPVASVLEWNTQAVQVVRKNGLDKYLTFGDGFLSLTSWHGEFEDVDPKLVMDTHQYMIFNVDELAFTHEAKISLACDGWAGMLEASEDPATGWGPILDGEWSQADTDCTEYLNNVGVGSRWEGTMNTGDPSTQVLTPTCPAGAVCSCTNANADPSQYSAEYKAYLLMLAEAQMFAFERVWGWFYWTWDTESAVQWSWKKGMEAGILPAKAYAPTFTCNSTVPDFSSLGLSEDY